jgi:hypothetical protein
MADLVSGDERFTVPDLRQLSEVVSAAWMEGANRNWSVEAGTLDWSCTRTADHAVDCVYAPSMFLASRRRDAYPDVGFDLTIGTEATPSRLVQSLQIATRILVAVVLEATEQDRAIIFRRPQSLTGQRDDFLARGALELILHAHDVCAGLGVSFVPSTDLCRRLREHTRPWPAWRHPWMPLAMTDDPWSDLLSASGRQPIS